MQTKKFLCVLGLAGLLFTQSCKRDKDLVPVPPPVPNESEVITTLELMVTDSSGLEAPKIFKFRDPDGEGGNSPIQFDTLKLKANQTFFVALTLLNETVSPTDTISKEILDEGDEHLFCFWPAGVSVSVIRTDSDGTYEVGLTSKWRTGNIGSGYLNVVLKHQPGIKNGTCDPGETDVEVNFPITLSN